jgi:hypothetical protein
MFPSRARKQAVFEQASPARFQSAWFAKKGGVMGADHGSSA